MNTTLDVEVTGHGPALLMLHGAGGSPRDDYPFLDELAQDFTVIAPSFPGVGGTAMLPGPLTVEKVADQVATTLAELDVETAAVCGYSMGTTVAVQLAAAHPERVSALALSAGFTRPRPAMRSLVEVWDALLDGPTETLGRFILGVTHRPETLDERGSAWIDEAAAEIGSTFPLGTRAHLDLIRTVDTTSALAATRQRTLVVVPEFDDMVDPAHSQDILEARPDAVRVDLPASHALGDEVPGQWLAALSDFVKTSG